MSIQRVNCPGCGTSLNVPAAMANVRCPSCTTVFNPNQPQAAQRPSAAQKTSSAGKKTAASETGSNLPIIAAAVGGAIMLLALAGVLIFVLGQPYETPAMPVPVESEEVWFKIVEFREVDIPEEQRRRIYDDLRACARTSVEQPILLPEGSPPRKHMEEMLQKVYDSEIRNQAALHNLEVDDVQQIVAEGDAKTWDPSPRSNATRGGKRIYPKEMSEGFEGKGPQAT